MDFIIEHLPVQTIVYMRRIGTYGSENYELMSSLKEWAKRKELFIDSTIYGIAQDNPANTPIEQCRYDACLIAKADCPVDELVLRGEIPAGKYAVFTIPHTAEAVQKFWSSFNQVLQEKGLQADLINPILERYKYRMVEEHKCEVCVPIL